MRVFLSLGALLAVGANLYCAQRAGADTPSPADTATQLAAIEKSIDARRQELHIPGASLVIVKDDKVIYVKGFGLRDIAKKLPVSPETQFAIGSSTKAFTAMTAMMSVDDGKLALSDSPRKFLPYFKMRDPEADSKITIGDLLCHRSGLGRTDLAWYTGKLNADETIRLVAEIKPTAKYGETFQYQNIMFLTAGQCVGAAQKAPWRTVVARRIFQPLGMKTTNTAIHDMVRSKDRAVGYSYDADKKESVALPYHELPAIAPAGAINSNVKEMAQWLRLMLGEGMFEGKRLVSEASFAELFKKRITVGGKVDYGYGWFLRDWNGHKVVEHGGNIDGFNAQVSLMPDQKLGFVLLTNVSASSLGAEAMNTIWQNLVGGPKPVEEPIDAVAAAEKVDPKLEAGTYKIQQANVDIVVAYKNDELFVHSAGLPETPLKNLVGRRYKVAVPGLDGVFATFRKSKENPAETELFFEQPGAKFVCKRVNAAPDAKDGAVVFVAPLTVDELMNKVVEAQGGEANLRRHKSLTLKISAAIETQGLHVQGTVYSRAPNAETSVQKMYAGKKTIGSLRNYFDGKSGGSETSFGGAAPITGDTLNDLATSSAFMPELNWKSLFKSAAITGKEKIGDEEVFLVEMKPEKGHPVTEYISTKTFRVLRRASKTNVPQIGQIVDQMETYDDFRTVDGVVLPFRRTSTLPGLGESVTIVQSAKFDAKLPDALFKPTRETTTEEKS